MADVFDPLLKWIGFKHFTPDNQLTPITRYGLIVRLAAPGYSQITPLIERALAPIDTRVRRLSLALEEVASQDNVPFTIHVTIWYYFDPRHLSKQSIAHVLGLTPSMRSDRLRDLVSQGIRRTAVCYPAELLCRAQTLSCIELDVSRYVRAQARNFGLHLQSSGIAIQEVIASEGFKRTIAELYDFERIIEELDKAKESGLIDIGLSMKLISLLPRTNSNMILVPSHLR